MATKKSKLYHVEISNRERGTRSKEKKMRSLALINKFVERSSENIQAELREK